MADEVVTKYTSTDLFKLANLLGPETRYVKLAKGTKRPIAKFVSKPTALTKTPPANANYGIIPGDNLLILDIDSKKGSSLSHQLKFFEHLFGFDALETFIVNTQSGGAHVYLRCPGTVDVKMGPTGSLRGYNDLFRAFNFPGVEKDLVVDADIRVSGINSYVVGPGSRVTGNYKRDSYTIQTQIVLGRPLVDIAEMRIQMIDEAKLQTFVDLKARKYGIDKALRSSEDKSFKSSLEDRKRIKITQENPLSESKMTTLKNRISEYSTFHEKRAHVSALMQCCFTDEQIAQVCIDLRVNRDTGRDNAISNLDLMKDLEKLRFGLQRFTETLRHGICGRGRKFDDAALKTLQRKLKQRDFARPVHEVTPKDRFVAVNMRKARKRLKALTNPESKQYANALAVLEGYVQPIFNAGGDRVVMAREDIQKTLSLTASQAAQALRLLKSSNIIFLKDRQKTGFASTWALTPEFHDIGKSASLQRLREKFASESFIPHFVLVDDLFVEVHGDRVFDLDGIAVQVDFAPYLSRVSVQNSRRYTVGEAKVREDLKTSKSSDESLSETVESPQHSQSDAMGVSIPCVSTADVVVLREFFHVLPQANAPPLEFEEMMA